MVKKKIKSLADNCCSPVMDKQRERQYQIEDGVRTLQKAGEIVKDKKLLKEIKSFAQQQITDLNKVAK